MIYIHLDHQKSTLLKALIIMIITIIIVLIITVILYIHPPPPLRQQYPYHRHYTGMRVLLICGGIGVVVLGLV